MLIDSHYETSCHHVWVAGEGLDDAAGRQLARHGHPLVDEVRLVMAGASVEFRLEFGCVRLAVPDLSPAMKEQPDGSHPQEQHEDDN